jgi:hypothetical protein
MIQMLEPMLNEFRQKWLLPGESSSEFPETVVEAHPVDVPGAACLPRANTR